eukprot:GEZU01006569.1.p1 GENE.GEZU01006569.1~~GEZU01006569.1.p1  ORF type:complete len:349 (-),score=148.14 GEZU01006569.1:173-1219(-)
MQTKSLYKIVLALICCFLLASAAIYPFAQAQAPTATEATTTVVTEDVVEQTKAAAADADESVTRTISMTVDGMLHSVEDHVKGVASDAVEMIETKTHDAYEYAKETAHEAVDAVKTKTSDAAEFVVEEAIHLKDAAVETVAPVAEAAKEKVVKVAEASVEYVDKVKDAAVEVTTETVIPAATKKVSQAKGAAVEFTKETAIPAAEKLKAAAVKVTTEIVLPKAEGALEVAKQFAQNLQRIIMKFVNDKIAPAMQQYAEVATAYYKQALARAKEITPQDVKAILCELSQQAVETFQYLQVRLSEAEKVKTQVMSAESKKTSVAIKPAPAHEADPITGYTFVRSKGTSEQ